MRKADGTCEPEYQVVGVYLISAGRLYSLAKVLSVGCVSIGNSDEMNIRLGDLGAKILGKMVAGYVTDPGDRTTILDFIRRSEIIREQLGSICPDMIHRGRLAFVPKNCGARSEEHTSELQSIMRISYT